MLAEVAGPDQRAAKKMRPGHCLLEENTTRPSKLRVSVHALK